MRQSPGRAAFAGQGARGRALPPHLGSPAAAGGSLCARLAFLKPLLVLRVFKKETNGAQKRAAPRASAVPLRLPLLPPLQSVWFCFESYVDSFGGCFSVSPTSTVNRCESGRSKHGLTRDGAARPAREFRIAAMRKVKALFKTIARLILLFILSFPSNRNTA